MEDGFGVFEGVVGADVGGGGFYFLANHDDGEKDELEESLGNPRNERAGPAVDGFWEANEGDEGKGIRAPHGADGMGYFFSKVEVKS